MKHKFRIWDNEEKKYFEPIYEAWAGRLLDLSISTSGRLLRRTLEMPAEDESRFEGRYEVEQFIGLIDKNGKEIYEGDFIKLTGGLRLEFYPDNGIVVFNTTSFCMKAKTESGDPWHFAINFSDGTEIEVVGNVHDVKELELIAAQ